MPTYEMRIIAGTLRGRKLHVPMDEKLRPMADRARAALFSILGNAVPDRPFFDVFAGSGAVGLEGLSRGASRVTFVERDRGTVATLHQHLERFRVADQVKVIQADAYRWGTMGALPADEPANVFLGPPYQEFDKRYDAVERLIQNLGERLAPGSVLVVQSDGDFPVDLLPKFDWDVRTYGRTQLAIWTKPVAPAAEPEPALEHGTA